jgi:hypothetical protein
MLCAFIPDIPDQPLTSISGDKVLINWISPSANGSPITSFRISLKQADLSFSEQLTYCDGSQADKVTSQVCEIPISTLEQAPYSLLVGDSIIAKVSCTNVYGESSYSPVGNGATIEKVPDAPIDLLDQVGVTSDSINAFTWSDGISHGGASIIDYTIMWDQGIDDWTQLVTNIVPKSYQTTVGLTAGATYKYKV